MLANEKLKFFADYIEKEIGIVYSDHIYYQLMQRLEKVAEYLSLEGGAEELYQSAKSKGIHGDFKHYLLDIATNNETSFFRDPKIYVAIEEKIIPDLAQDTAGRKLRVWSAAASFGQEPYSLAILFDEMKASNPSLPPIEIKATDISDRALERCRRAIYSQLEVQRGLSSPRLVKYFEPVNEKEWKLLNRISSQVDFSRQNLLDSFALAGQFDLILCRYVLIYQDGERKKTILKRMTDCLRPGGYLVLGGSESIIGMGLDMQHTEHKSAVFYQKK